MPHGTLLLQIGVTWVKSRDRRNKFSSWTVHMPSIIIFSSLSGIEFKEWKGAVERDNF
jgi:hypothetical protein